MLRPALILTLACAAAPVAADEAGPWAAVPEVTMPAFEEAKARALYLDRCATCHGRSGRGDGPVARNLEPRPRDLVRGVYKFRSTPSGQLPTDQDLFDTLTRGLPGTAMPSWSGLAEWDRWQLVQYVKRLSPRFSAERPERTVVLERKSAPSVSTVGRGRAAWVKMQCGKCHGDDGRGWGEAARTQRDDLGRAIYPFNLTRGENYRVGPRVEDVFRTLFTGLDGTPMPSYEDALGTDEAWDLAEYVRSLAVPAGLAVR